MSWIKLNFPKSSKPRLRPALALVDFLPQPFAENDMKMTCRKWLAENDMKSDCLIVLTLLSYKLNYTKHAIIKDS